MLFRSAGEYNVFARLPPPTEFTGGRATLASALRQATGSYGDPLSGLPSHDPAHSAPAGDERPASQVLPIVADRLALPARGAFLDVREFLPQEWQDDLNFPASRLHLPADLVPPLPRTASVGTQAERLKFYDRLIHAGMAEYRDAATVPRAADGQHIRAGQFGVPKSTTVDRPVVSKVRANRAEKPWRCPRLAHAALLTRIVLPWNRVIRINLFDLPDYYHTLTHGPAYTPFCQLGDPIPVALLRLVPAHTSTYTHPHTYHVYSIQYIMFLYPQYTFCIVSHVNIYIYTYSSFLCHPFLTC